MLPVFPMLGMAAAPLNSWAAQRAALPPDLLERRTSEWKRTWERRPFVRRAAAGGLVTVLGVIAAAVALLLTPTPTPTPTPSPKPSSTPTPTSSSASSPP